MDPRNQIDGGRLAGTVVAQKPDDFAWADVEAQVPQRRQRAKRLGDIVQFEKMGCKHHTAPRRSMRWLNAAAITMRVAINMSR